MPTGDDPEVGDLHVPAEAVVPVDPVISHAVGIVGIDAGRVLVGEDREQLRDVRAVVHGLILLPDSGRRS